MKPPPPPTGEATVESVLPGEAAVAAAARRSLDGHARGIGRVWPFLGPAFIAAVAYIDPGNFATNIAGGAKFGYLLLWVVLAANLIAMLVQTQSAKLGIATGRNLAEALGMPEDRVHEEAEVLEHYISEELELLIAAKLGEPSHDPHGTPIPGPDLLPPAEGSGVG